MRERERELGMGMGRCRLFFWFWRKRRTDEGLRLVELGLMSVESGRVEGGGGGGLDDRPFLRYGCVIYEKR